MKFFKTPLGIIIIITIIILAGVYFFFTREKKLELDFVTVKKETLTQEVNIIGRVNPSESVELAFETNGKILRVSKEVGDKVYTGEIILTLGGSELLAELAGKEANLQAEIVTLKKMEAGSRPEEIKIQELEVAKNKISLEEAKKSLVDTTKDAYTKSDDALRNRIDQFINNPASANPQLDFVLNNAQLKSDIEFERTFVETVLISWSASLTELTEMQDLAKSTALARKNLFALKSLLDKTATAINSLVSTSNLNQTTIDAWKADTSTARNNINTAISNVQAGEEALKTAQINLKLAEEKLILEIAGVRKEEIASQEAKIAQAKANIQNTQAKLAKRVMRSPITGIVTKQEAKVGEIISANSILVSVISEDDFEIKANTPEADISKVTIGDGGNTTLDAYGDDINFAVKVIKIDPAETIIEGVAVYKTTLVFIKEDSRIKPGMTANIDILTATKKDVILIPSRAVINRAGEKFVKIFNNKNAVEEKRVTTGIRDSFGNIEITDGIEIGDKVITFIKD